MHCVGDMTSCEYAESVIVAPNSPMNNELKFWFIILLFAFSSGSGSLGFNQQLLWVSMCNVVFLLNNTTLIDYY